MKNKSGQNRYGMPEIGWVLSALNDDVEALERLMQFYRSYLRSCIFIKAGLYSMAYGDIPLEDISQTVMLRYIMAIRKFTL